MTNFLVNRKAQEHNNIVAVEDMNEFLEDRESAIRNESEEKCEKVDENAIVKGTISKKEENKQEKRKEEKITPDKKVFKPIIRSIKRDQISALAPNKIQNTVVKKISQKNILK